MQKKFWNDFKTGEKIKTPGITITDAHLVQWTDLQWIFIPFIWMRNMPKKLFLGEELLDGPLTFALSVGLMFLTNTFEDSIIAWLGLENMRIPTPVKIGDTIYVEATVKEEREQKSQKEESQYSAT